jgi:putative peptidoglycan lipid II flippase
MSLVKKFATVGSGTMLSRIFGFAREMMMAAALGTGPVAEAFYAAFQFPNTFRRLFAEGAFNAAFVPLFAREIEAGGVAGAKKFSEEVFGVLFSVLLLLTIAMELAMPFVIRYAIAPGFAEDPAKLLLTTELAAIMFPYLICMSLGAMMAGMLNSLHRYFAAAIAPVFLNIILVGILVVAWYRGHDGPGVGTMLAWGVLAAGIVQLAIVFFAVRRAGVSIGFRRPRLTRNVRRLLWLALPAAITGGITQINTLVGTAIASGKAGAVPALNLADRVYQLPLGVVGVAVGVVLLPELARALRSGNRIEAANLQNRSVEFTLFLTLPAAAALLTMSEPIVRVLYERGAFLPEDTAVVAEVLAIFGIGLPAFVLIKAFTPGYFAREDTRTPMIFAAISVAVNICTALWLFPTMGAPGIATASAAAGWVNTALLFGVLIVRGHWASDTGLTRRMPRLLIACALMAGAIHLAVTWLAPQFDPATPIATQAAALLAIVFGAMIVYFATAFGLGGADLGMIRRNIRRGSATQGVTEPSPDP